MILTCNSCEKKFVVPDEAIGATGRTVQCGSCGNKWKQFPIKKITSKIINKKEEIKKTTNFSKPKNRKKRVNKVREINLYSPEYLAKKHGITLKSVNTKETRKINKISFGFYNSLILYLVILIAFSKGLHFFQEFIILKLPFTEFYLNYFFESIRNMFEIWKNLISSY